MAADPLSDILALLDARCVLGGGLVAGGRWVRHFAQPNAIKVMAQIEGACWLVVDGLPAPIRLATGDVIVVNGKHALTMASDPEMLATADNSPTVQHVDDITRVGEGREFFMLGGHVAIDPTGQSLLLDVLPPLVHIRADSAEAGAVRWLLDQLAREWTGHLPGAATATAQLAQLLFVQALRAHLRMEGPAASGWLNGLGDGRIAPILGLIHADPARTWTLIELAKAAGMSRTGFAQRFRAVVGVAPLAYLTR
ncbi:MAG TPA: AraC family transcriptional regulator, partial [Devosia sp.]|nr:AraC family transcriptional regulator [Devosia sp.]